VKSHGSADATGVAAAVKLAYQLPEQGLTDKIKARVASVNASDQDARTEGK
jgi:glycerol-3-phosphate acyltransferase PlsX